MQVPAGPKRPTPSPRFIELVRATAGKLASRDRTPPPTSRPTAPPRPRMH